jgi:hypothetical protein
MSHGLCPALGNILFFPLFNFINGDDDNDRGGRGGKDEFTKDVFDEGDEDGGDCNPNGRGGKPVGN